MTKEIELEEGPTKCSKKGWCAPLKTMLASSGPASGPSKGLVSGVLFKGHGVVPAVFYKRSRNERALALRFCPWCGEKVDHYREMG